MRLAICAVVKNEAPTILEWVAFHHLVGFDTIFIIDDDSNDGTRQRVLDAGAVLDVRLSTRQEWQGLCEQHILYERLCRRLDGEFDWIAFVDSDELIVPEADESITSLLGRHRASSAVAFPWLMFGSSGHTTKPSGLMIDAFQKRAPTDFGPNRHAKSIVRPRDVVRGINAHFFECKSRYSLPDGTIAEWQQPGVLKSMPTNLEWRIHHYFTRSRAHWTERMLRGQLGGTTRTAAEFDAYDRNEIGDACAARFGPAVRIIVDRILTAAQSMEKDAGRS
jgi:glycosyltransferase involved in cell wall biosynthesis